MPCQGGYEVALIGVVMEKDVGDEIAAGKIVKRMRKSERSARSMVTRWRAM